MVYSVDELLNQGRKALAEHHPEIAEQHFLKVVEHNPHRVDTWCDLAEARREMDDAAGALAALRSALAVQPNHPRALVLRRRMLNEVTVTQDSRDPNVPSTDQPGAKVLFDLVASYGPNAQTSRRVMSRAQRRQFFTQELSWSIPTKAAVDEIVTFTQGQGILEVGAGKGLWAALIQKSGGHAIPTTPWYQARTQKDGLRSYRSQSRTTFTDVARMDAFQAIQSHPECKTLMMCWPSMDTPPPQQVLSAFHGDRFIFVGEKHLDSEPGPDGLTFRQQLERDWTLTKAIRIPNWPGVYDAVYCYTRNSGLV